MQLETVYRKFVQLDEAQELATVAGRNGPSERLKGLWRKWHQIDYRMFCEWVWQLQGATHLAEFIATTGSVNLALRVLTTLSRSDYLQVSPQGDVAWSKPVFPIQAPAPRYPDLCDPSNPPLREFTNDLRLGQFRISWESSLKRARRVSLDLPPGDTSVLFCGDDDFTSLALANLTLLDIVVGDVDDRVLGGIEEVSARYDLGIRTCRLDVREEAGSEMRGKFHAFYCDPFDHGSGLDLWLARAMEVLTGQVGDRIYLNTGMSRLGGRITGLQALLAGQGFALVDMERRHSLYPVPEEPMQHGGPLFDRATELGLLPETITATSIHSDLFVFRRVRSRPELWPQDYLDIRRQL